MRISILCFCLLLGLSTTAFAAPGEEMKKDKETSRADDLVVALQKRYETQKSFSAAVVQHLKNATSGNTVIRRGTIAFRQPGLVWWNTVDPEKELLVMGQEIVWNFFPDEEVAYKYTVSDMLRSKTVLRFLSGQVRLDSDFYVTYAGKEEGLEKLELTPKEPDPEMVQAVVWIVPQFTLLKKIRIVDFFGNENMLILSDIEQNPDLPDSMFTFVPEEGVTVRDNTK